MLCKENHIYQSHISGDYIVKENEHADWETGSERCGKSITICGLEFDYVDIT